MGRPVAAITGVHGTPYIHYDKLKFNSVFPKFSALLAS